MDKNRETFSTRLAVIMAMAGSAIGMGNIWRFPYMVGEGGGAAFIIIYIAISFILLVPVMVAESLIGRRARQNSLGAMRTLAPGSKWVLVGILNILTSLVLVSYYSVVGGWSIDYLFQSLQFRFTQGEDVASMFGNFISNPWWPLLCHTVFLAVTALIVLGGVKKGIEKFSSVTMPILFVLMILIMFYSLSLPGAKEGVDYLIKPDFSKVNATTVAYAMGQAFFSLSIGNGSLLIYASYMDRKGNLLTTGASTALFDFMFAILAGFAIMPAVFAAGIKPESGPGLIFETLPFVFSKMGINALWVSNIAAILFFIAILVAALTSSISMYEVIVAYLTEEKHMDRKKAVLLLFICTWVIGCLCSLSFGPLRNFHLLGNTMFDFCDKLVSNFMLPLGGLLFSLFVGWKMDKKAVRDEITNGGTARTNGRLFGFLYFMIKYVAPIAIVIIFVTNLILS